MMVKVVVVVEGAEIAAGRNDDFILLVVVVQVEGMMSVCFMMMVVMVEWVKKWRQQWEGTRGFFTDSVAFVPVKGNLNDGD